MADRISASDPEQQTTEIDSISPPDWIGKSTGVHCSSIEPTRRATRFLQNPLRQFTPEELDVEVDHFVDRNPELADLRDLLHLGAQIARDPFAPQAAKALLPDDQQALRDENEHPFRYPRKYWLTVGACCCAAALQGWSQVGIVPGNAVWPQEFGVDRKSARGNWIIGATNSACYFAAALLGVWTSDPLNERFGRRGTLLCAAVFNFASTIGAAGSRTWWEVLLCRIFTGIAMGMKASVAPVLAAEISPASTRGSVVMGSWQICVAGGILLGFSANLAMQSTGKGAWRYQIGSPFILSLPLFLVCTRLCAESPRYFIKKGRYREAFDVLCSIRNRRLQAARDLYAIAAQVEIENNYFQAAGPESAMYWKRFKQLFSDMRNRTALIAAAVIMLGQQLCGINVIIFFGATLFMDAHASLSQSLWVSWGIGLVNMIFGFIGVYYCDKIGRRRLLLWLYPVMCVCMLAAGLSYIIPVSAQPNSAHVIIISLFIFLFVAAYSPGQGPIAFLYSSEAMPVTHREVGMSLCVAINLFWAGMLALLFPRMDHVMGPQRTLGTFAGLNIVAMILVFFLCPETKLYTLEELDAVFEVATMRFVRHKAEYLSALFQFYVLGRKKVDFRDLYEGIGVHS